MELTPKQQASEALRQAQSILIVTGQHPNVDQVASVMALAAVLRKLGKKVSAVVSDAMPANIDFLPLQSIEKSMDGLRDFIVKVDLSKAEVDKLKYTIENGKLNIHITPFKGKFSSTDVAYDYGDVHYDVAMVLGVPTRARIDRVVSQSLFEQVPIVNIDFHRSNDNYGAINLIEPTASSLSEIIAALAESLQNGVVDEQISTALLTGIIASTDRFTATHTTPKSLTVAAQLMAAGANQQQIVKSLFRKADRKPAIKPEAKPEVRSVKPQPKSEAVSRQPESDDLPLSPLEALEKEGLDLRQSREVASSSSSPAYKA